MFLIIFIIFLLSLRVLAYSVYLEIVLEQHPYPSSCKPLVEYIIVNVIIFCPGWLVKVVGFLIKGFLFLCIYFTLCLFVILVGGAIIILLRFIYYLCPTFSLIVLRSLLYCFITKFLWKFYRRFSYYLFIFCCLNHLVLVYKADLSANVSERPELPASGSLTYGFSTPRTLKTIDEYVFETYHIFYIFHFCKAVFFFILIRGFLIPDLLITRTFIGLLSHLVLFTFYGASMKDIHAGRDNYIGAAEIQNGRKTFFMNFIYKLCIKIKYTFIFVIYKLPPHFKQAIKNSLLTLQSMGQHLQFHNFNFFKFLVYENAYCSWWAEYVYYDIIIFIALYRDVIVGPVNLKSPIPYNSIFQYNVNTRYITNRYLFLFSTIIQPTIEFVLRRQKG